MSALARDFGFTSDQLQAVTSQAFDLLEAGELDSAEVLFTGLVALEPDDAGLCAARGSVLHAQGRTAEALAAYDAALTLDPATPLARVNRGELRCQAGDARGLEDLRFAACHPSPLQAKARRLAGRYAL